MSRHDRWIDRALAVAGTSRYRWKVGAVVTGGARLLGCSPNKYRNPPWIDHDNATLHAEMAALARCSQVGDTVYVARVNRQGEPRLAKPCDRCLYGLTAEGVRFIVFTTNDGTYTVKRL